MRSSLIFAGFVLMGCKPVRAAEPVQIDYVLPAVNVTAGVSHQVTKCPVSADAQARPGTSAEDRKVGFAIKAAIAPKQVPGRLVMLNAETGFLVDRETKAHFNGDWYLKDFNGKTTGQGGPLLVSLIKAGAAVATMTANPIAGAGVAAAALAPAAEGVVPIKGGPYYATKWYLECLPEVAERLGKLEQRREEVAKLEARVIAGDVSAATQELLAMRRGQVGELESALTIKSTLKGGLMPTFARDGSVTNLSGGIEAPDWSRLLRIRGIRKQVKSGAYEGKDPEPGFADLLQGPDYKTPGIYGYQVKVAPDARLAAWFGCTPDSPRSRRCSEELIAGKSIETRDLVYLRPIPASAELWPNPVACAKGQVCDADKTWIEAKDASGSAEVKLPQLSRFYRMRTGGSIFGGRTVGAEFGAMGEPTMLQYDIGGGAKDVAGVIDAGVAGVQTVRDAPGAATKRKLDELKNARDLQDLLDEMDKDASTPAATDPVVAAPAG